MNECKKEGGIITSSGIMSKDIICKIQRYKSKGSTVKNFKNVVFWIYKNLDDIRRDEELMDRSWIKVELDDYYTTATYIFRVAPESGEAKIYIDKNKKAMSESEMTQEIEQKIPELKMSPKRNKILEKIKNQIYLGLKMDKENVHCDVGYDFWDVDIHCIYRKHNISLNPSEIEKGIEMMDKYMNDEEEKLKESINKLKPEDLMSLMLERI